MFWLEFFCCYGSMLPYRALVVIAGLGANTVEVAVYPKTEGDGIHTAFGNVDGKIRYSLAITGIQGVATWFFDFHLHRAFGDCKLNIQCVTRR